MSGPTIVMPRCASTRRHRPSLRGIPRSEQATQLPGAIVEMSPLAIGRPVPESLPQVRDSGWYRQSGVGEPPQHEYLEESVRLEPLAGRPARSSVVVFPSREHRAGKPVLNQLMLSFAARHGDDPRTLLLIAPGWVKIDLGGPSARLNVDEPMPRHGCGLGIRPTETPHF